MDNISAASTTISTVATGYVTLANSLSQGYAIVVVTAIIIASNVISMIVWRRIDGILPVTKLILLNLSVSDVLVGIVACAPAIYPAFTGHWPFGDVWCQISGVTHSVSCSMSVWCISMVGVDRYIAVIWPFRYKRVMSLRNTVIIMTTLWLCAIITFVAPIFAKANFVYYQYTTEVKMCGIYWGYPLLCIITALYIPFASSAVIVFTSFRIYQSLNNLHVPRADANRKALRKLIVSAVAFFVCWGPYVTLSIMTSFVPAVKPPALLQFWSMWLANCNSFMNVFVYSITNQSFRKAVVRLVMCRGAAVAPEPSALNGADA
ncbi:Neuropeptide FF receptor 2 [Lamellibrachia satsuma]|nr:Neuropeptide FF receptor 2 [Lamellibrachia satsuma]